LIQNYIQKESITKYFPKLTGMINRIDEDLEYLESMKIDFVKFGKLRSSTQRGTLLEKEWEKSLRNQSHSNYLNIFLT